MGSATIRLEFDPPREPWNASEFFRTVVARVSDMKHIAVDAAIADIELARIAPESECITNVSYLSHQH